MWRSASARFSALSASPPWQAGVLGLLSATYSLSEVKNGSHCCGRQPRPVFQQTNQRQGYSRNENPPISVLDDLLRWTSTMSETLTAARLIWTSLQAVATAAAIMAAIWHALKRERRLHPWK
jgi:hypothetical protein